MQNTQPNQELIDFIQGQLQQGMTSEEIAGHLKNAGWQDDQIQAAFKVVSQSIMPANQEADSQDKAAITNSSTENTYADYESRLQRGRLRTGWLLAKQSFKILRSHRQLIRYPMMSVLLTVAITAIFGVIAFISGDTFYVEQTDFYGETEYVPTGPGYVLLFLFYITTNFVVYIYGAGIAAHILDIFRGQQASYQQYMRLAWKKAGVILVFSFITATVGIILRAIAERSRLLGRVVVWIVGAAWSLATAFAVPVIVTSDKRAWGSIKHSALLFKNTWGENLTGRLSVGGIVFLVWLIGFLPISVLTILIAASIADATLGLIIFMSIFVISILVFSVIEQTINQILNTALFYYGEYKQVPASFSPEMLNSVVQKKAQKRR